VPWLKTETDTELSILLKSGNLGDPRLFLHAWDHGRMGPRPMTGMG